MDDKLNPAWARKMQNSVGFMVDGFSINVLGDFHFDCVIGGPALSQSIILGNAIDYFPIK